MLQFPTKDLGANSCNLGNCREDSYTCKSCTEMLCLPCVEDEGNGKGCSECGNWYCDESDCADENLAKYGCGVAIRVRDIAMIACAQTLVDTREVATSCFVMSV